MTVNWIDLPTVRAFLQFSGTSAAGDDVLQPMIDAACSSIERIKGRIGEDTVAGELQPIDGCGYVFLDERPVISVQSVSVIQSGATPLAIAKADPATGVLTGWTLKSAGGVVSVPFGQIGVPSCDGQVLVDYTVGRNPVPPDWEQAAVELAGFLYRESQNNADAGRVGAGADDEDWPSRAGAGIGAYAMPFRVRELLGLYGKVVRSQVLVR